MSQVKTRNTKLKTVMSSRAFRVGFDEARAGKPFNPDFGIDNPKGIEWDYERGRQFGLIYTGALKYGNKLSVQAMYAFSDAIYARAII